MSPSEKVRAMLDERGIEYTANDEEHVKETCWPYMGELMAVFAEYDNGTTRFACDTWCFTPEQAIAATVGAEPWEPSKEWKAWHESLKHDNPTSIREAVENILYEAIDFGGDMGPNGNVWSGVDEGDVLTDGCINGWVKSIEEIAATVTTDPDEATMLKLHDRINAALLDYVSAMGIEGGNGANTVPFVIEMHSLLEEAATMGVGTCKAIDTGYATAKCSECGAEFMGSIMTNEPPDYVKPLERCPRCGRRIIEEVTE